MARRTAGKLAYEAGIERGTPDVSIAREMDTPFHRVLLSGLVYARARLTAEPCLNRRSGSQPVRAHRLTSPRVGVLHYIIDSVFRSSLHPTVLRRAKRPDATRRNAPCAVRIISDLFDAGFYRVSKHVDEIGYYLFFNIRISRENAQY